MKKFLCIILAFAMTLSMLTTVSFAASADNVELVSIDYLLKKGSNSVVNITKLSNKMEVLAKVKNNSDKGICVRVDGYKNNKIVSGQSVTAKDYTVDEFGNLVFSVKLSGNVKTYCDNITVNVVADDHSEKKIAVFPAISLGIMVNGKELTGYSDDLDEYDVCLNTPYPYFDMKARGSMQKDLDMGVNYKMPYTRTVKASQIGKDDSHRIDRTIKLNFTTTSPAPTHISNDNMIFWVQKDNNIDQNVFDKTTTKWTDISGYKNNIESIKDIWTKDGLKATTKWSNDKLTELPKKVVDAVNNGDFTIKFKLGAVNNVSGANLAIIGSDNENFRIFMPKDSNKLYFRYAGARFTPLMVSVNSADAIGKENTITVNKASGEVKWYLNGIANSTKTYAMDIKNTVSKLTLSDVKIGNAGSVIFDEIKVFNKALTSDEVKNTDIINPDTSMSDWYKNVDAAIALCGNIKDGINTPSVILSAITDDTLDDSEDKNIKYFCRDYDDFAKNNVSTIIDNVAKKINVSSINEDFLSYSSIANMTEEAILALKNKNGVVIDKADIKSYIANSCREDVAALINDLNEGAIDSLVNKVNTTKSLSDKDFANKVTREVIIASIENPKEYNYLDVADKIIRYSSDLGINLNGFDKLNANNRATIAQKIANTKPSTAQEIEKLIYDAMNNDNSPSGSTGGGLVSSPTNATQNVVTLIAGFDDMAGSEWVEPALRYMVDNGFVSGVAVRKFAPKNHITRAEFVAIISRCEGFDLDQDFDLVFNDVPSNFWGYKNVMSAYQNGIISGVDKNTFNPNGNITRQDIAVILYNVYKSHKVYEESNSDFTDWNDISEYAKEAVGKLHSLQVLNGYGDSFEPKGLCTRAEAVQAIYSYLQAVNR